MVLNTFPLLTGGNLFSRHPLPVGRLFCGLTGWPLRLSSCLAPGGSWRAFHPDNQDFSSRAFDESVALPVVGYNYGDNERLHR